MAVLTVVWFLRALPRERLFLGAAHTTPARDTDRVLRVYDENRTEKVEVAFTPGPTVQAKGGQSLLEVAEANQVNMEAGCRMGMCGADPVRVTAGMENLSPVSSAERATLERLGLPAECRMACSAHVQGPVTVVPTADPAAVQGEPAATVPEEGAIPGFAISEEVRRIVVIGAGAAGVNAAIEVRKLHAGAEITLLGDEPYDFYNRMGIGKLVSESTAIDKLYLMPRDWASARRIRYLRGISATAIDRAKQEVRTDQGESIPYDRLLLATGAQSFVPEIEGFGLEGTFVLRTIDDAVQVQQYIRRRSCRRALIIGGGLLGLEAAHSITELGAYAFVLNRNEWPLNRQLDRPAGTLLGKLMQDFGIAILPWPSRAESSAPSAWRASYSLTDGSSGSTPVLWRPASGLTSSWRGNGARRPARRRRGRPDDDPDPHILPPATSPSMRDAYTGSGRRAWSRPTLPPPTCLAATCATRAPYPR